MNSNEKNVKETVEWNLTNISHEGLLYSQLFNTRLIKKKKKNRIKNIENNVYFLKIKGIM